MEPKLKKGLAGLASAVALSVTCNIGNAADAQDRYVTQAMIDAEGGYPLMVPKLGRFKVTKVYLPERPGKACKVSTRALGKQLHSGFANGTWQAASGVKVTVELE